MKKSLIFLTLLFAANAVMAQVTVNQELKSLITQSFGYFPKIKEVENTVTTAQEKLALTQLNKSPEITGVASYEYLQPKIVIPLGGADFQFAPVHSLNGNVNATYSLFDFGRLKANVTKTKDELQFAKHNVDNVKAQLANQVAIIYYNIVYLQKAISIQDSVINFLSDNKTIVQSKLKNGDALKIDLLNIQANIDAEQNRKVDLLNSLQKQLNLLEYTTGIKQNNGQVFDFDINLTDANAALSVAQTTNVDFLLAKDKIKQSQSDLEIAKLGDKPFVGLNAIAGTKNGYIPEVNNLKFNYAAGISLSIPIYNGGKTKQQIRLQQNIVKQNELAVESLNSNYKKDIEQTLTDIKSNYERINNTKGQTEQALYAEQLAATRFKNGVGTNLELTNASTNVQRALLTKLQYEYQLCLAKVELARLMGYQYW
ncbi:outer membrane efflux protein [mine drainage metagenome]|uniref:Outer membrane efflux protein n=1 Tax=mine drainage metagenome TaxID=410659 RepID=A0A1J5RGF4_9ZZZZ